jgi:hypothetical protein
VTFTAYGVGSVDTGDEFEVPDEVADAFSARNDIELVVDSPPAKPARGSKAVTSDAAPAETPAVETPAVEDVDAVPDDH